MADEVHCVIGGYAQRLLVQPAQAKQPDEHARRDESPRGKRVDGGVSPFWILDCGMRMGRSESRSPLRILFSFRIPQSKNRNELVWN
jgi:hypothetical protein